MAQAARGTTPRNIYTNRNMTAYNDIYVEGSAARDLDARRRLEGDPRRPLSSRTRKNRDRAHHMSVGYVLFLMAALGFFAYVLISYVQLQSEITNKVKTIAYQESVLNNLQLENEENYNKIVSSVDLEEIKKIAIGELGMVYAQEGQIVTYSNAGADYMRKVND